MASWGTLTHDLHCLAYLAPSPSPPIPHPRPAAPPSCSNSMTTSMTQTCGGRLGL
jgi:hypothetical protein